MDSTRSFEWDATKAELNEAKHGVSFDDAIFAFADPEGGIETDERIDYGETRFRLFGSVDGVPLCVVFTMRGDITRVISARKANRKERSR